MFSCYLINKWHYLYYISLNSLPSSDMTLLNSYMGSILRENVNSTKFWQLHSFSYRETWSASMQRHCDYGICFAVHTSEVNIYNSCYGLVFLLALSQESWLWKTILHLHEKGCTWQFHYAPSIFCTGKLQFTLLFCSGELTVAACCEVDWHKKGFSS